MSAAEKLKVLMERPVSGQAEYLRVTNELADALPLIVAVVEAAEAIVQAEDDWDVYAKTPALADALSALDEKLTGAA